MEEWRDIKGYEGKYQVSNLGRVKSLRNSQGQYREKILKTGTHKNDYKCVHLFSKGTKRSFLIHRLVAQSFIDNPDNYKEINHKDENKQNNKAENLEWCDRKYNCNYGNHNKKLSTSNKGKNKGSKSSRARKVQCITTGKKFNCIQEAAEYYNIKSSLATHISDVCKGKRNYCGKHPVTGEKLIWRYIDDRGNK